MNKFHKTALSMFISALALTGCASNPVARHIEYQEEVKKKKVTAMEKELAEVPEWFLKPTLSDENGAYAAATAKSTDLMHAINKAKLQAEFGIAKKINQVVSGRERMHSTERNGQFQSTNEQTVIKQVSRADIVGYKVVDQVVQVQGHYFVTYVLIHLDFDAQQRILNLNDKSFIQEAYKAYEEVEAAAGKAGSITQAGAEYSNASVGETM